MSTSTFTGRHHSYAAASGELTDAEVEHRFGDVLAMASTAYVTDPTYFVEMASNASSIADRRETTSARREAMFAQEGSTLQEATSAVLERRRST